MKDRRWPQVEGTHWPLTTCRFPVDERRLATVGGQPPSAEGATNMAGKFEVYQDKKGEYRFRLKAGNGQTIATGEGYSTKKACLNGIESIRKNAPDAKLDDQTA
jgi:uncharacterized protein YegP (UPF0339 family)